MTPPTRYARTSTTGSRALGLALALALTAAGLAGLAHQFLTGWTTDRLPNDGITLLAYSMTLAGAILTAHWARAASRRHRHTHGSRHTNGSALHWPDTTEAGELPTRRQDTP